MTLDCNTATYVFLADFGVHDFDIQLVNKQFDDTIVDSKGNILDDLYASIESVKVDNFEFKNQLDSISRYTDTNGNQVDTFGFLGYNSPYKLLLQTPGYMLKRNMGVLTKGDIFTHLLCLYG